jgi:hypothetical protein
MTTTGFKILDNLNDKYKDAIKDFTDERDNGDGFWIYLKAPFYNEHLECRIIHEQKLTDCINQLKTIVNLNITHT